MTMNFITKLVTTLAIVPIMSTSPASASEVFTSSVTDETVVEYQFVPYASEYEAFNGLENNSNPFSSNPFAQM